MVKVYTKTGDSGSTSLFGGSRVGKDDLRIAAYGSVDELNSLIGVITSEMADNVAVGRIKEKLIRVQGELMVLGADLATPPDVKIKIPRITKAFISRLEKEIDIWEKSITPLKNFILPGGSLSGSHIHLARTVARRAEREIVLLGNSEKINNSAQVYINRLSDWLFVLARFVNKLDGVKETSWIGRKTRKK